MHSRLSEQIQLALGISRSSTPIHPPCARLRVQARAGRPCRIAYSEPAYRAISENGPAVGSVEWAQSGRIHSAQESGCASFAGVSPSIAWADSNDPWAERGPWPPPTFTNVPSLPLLSLILSRSRPTKHQHHSPPHHPLHHNTAAQHVVHRPALCDPGSSF